MPAARPPSPPASSPRPALSALVPLPVLAALGDRLGTAAYFVAAEALAVFSAWSVVALERYNRGRILELADAKGRRASALAHLDRVGTYDVTVRLTRFAANALLVIGIAWRVLQAEAPERATWDRIPWAVLGTALGLAFGLTFLVNDLGVRLLARRRPNRFLLAAFPALGLLRVATAPIRVPTVFLTWLLFRVRLDSAGPGARAEVRVAVEEAERESALTAGEADMMKRILDLDERTVGDVLTVRGEAQMLKADATVAEAVALAFRTGHSRFPVYGRDKDEVVGYVNVRDLLPFWGRPDGSAPRMRDVMRPPVFLPATKPIREVLEEMRERRTHLAIVTDEFGGVGGLVTIEDLLEAIVGPIDDEYDTEALAAAAAKQAVAGTLVVDGRTPIEEVNRALRVALPIEEDFETVGGLVLHRLGKVPSAGEHLTLAGVALTVTEADERTVRRLQVKLLPDGP